MIALSWIQDFAENAQLTSEWLDKCDKLPYLLETCATANLKSVVAVPHVTNELGKDTTVLRPLVESVPNEAIMLANFLWRSTHADRDPGLAEALLTTARTEFARSELSSCLTAILFSRDPDARIELSPQEVVRRAEIVDWQDADSIVRRPLGVMFYESPAERFAGWCARFDYDSNQSVWRLHMPDGLRTYVFLEPDIFCAIVLTWLDQAMADSSSSFKLLADCVVLLHQAGIYHGWQGNEAILKEDAALAGKLGGAARHRKTAELKAWATLEASSLKGSQMEIARRLAQAIPKELIGASSDPERLIYETLRASTSKGA